MTPSTKLIAFEKESDLGPLLAQFGIFQDYKSILPEHLHDILRNQHPGVVIESIELLDTPKCNLGGIQMPGNETLVRVQTLRAPLDLRLTLIIGTGRHSLDVQLIFICEGLDETPTVRSDMLVKAHQQHAQ